MASLTVRFYLAGQSLDLTVNSHSFLSKKQSENIFGDKFGIFVPNFDEIFKIKLITNNHVSSNKGFLEDGPLDGANMRPRKNEQKKEKRLSYAEAHREEFERPKSQIRKVSSYSYK